MQTTPTSQTDGRTNGLQTAHRSAGAILCAFLLAALLVLPRISSANAQESATPQQPTAEAAAAPAEAAPSPAPETPAAPAEQPQPAAAADAVKANDPAAPAANSEFPLPEPGAAPDAASAEGEEEVEEEIEKSPSVTINLIRALVEKKLLGEEEARQMIAQAEAEAEIARSEIQSEMSAIAEAAASQAAAEQLSLASAQFKPPTSETISVGYVPFPVREQLKEEIKAELLSDPSSDPFGVAGLVPPWVNKIKFTGDIRTRYDNTAFPEGNDATGSFPDFNAINTGDPFDITGFQFAPQLNVDQDRNQFRFRARLGVAMELEDQWAMGIRLATGSSRSPVSTNQSFGGSGAQFGKYATWLDRAFITTQWGSQLDRGLQVFFGRFDNPFLSTPLIWDDDLGFDGVAATGVFAVRDITKFPNVKFFGAGGAFPVYNTDFNFSSNQPAKYESIDKYLFGGQAGIEFLITEDLRAKFAAAYYSFENIEGRLSTPFTPLTADDEGDTDPRRPAFAQKGNTYMALRNILPDASNDFGAINQWQYYGLATRFENLAFTGRIDYDGFEPVQVSLIGEWTRNVRFNKEEMEPIAINNRGVDNDELDETLGLFDGDDTAWLVEARVGTPAFDKAGNWALGFGYRYIGSDAVVDGFNDSDFGLGGTNMEGYTASASFALSKNVWLALRYMSAENIAGPPFKADIFQFDLNAKF